MRTIGEMIEDKVRSLTPGERALLVATVRHGSWGATGWRRRASKKLIQYGWLRYKHKACKLCGVRPSETVVPTKEGNRAAAFVEREK